MTFSRADFFASCYFRGAKIAPHAIYVLSRFSPQPARRAVPPIRILGSEKPGDLVDPAERDASVGGYVGSGAAGSDHGADEVRIPLLA